MKIQVTQEDISTSLNLMNNRNAIIAFSCPVAIAMKRVTGFECMVGVDTVKVDWNNYSIPQIFYPLPEHVIKFIDSLILIMNKPNLVQPFEFEIAY